MTDLVVMAGLQNIVVDEQIVSQEIQLVFHVLEEAADQRSQMNNMRWLVLFKDFFGLRGVTGLH
jgi:hypothetical protein